MSALPVLAQKEGNIWYFGVKAGIDFNTDPPSILNKSAMSTWEGCASVANKKGKLLFYTDGKSIYNNNHTVMSNGTHLTGNVTSVQSALIVQNPDSGNIYFVFTNYDTLAYSVVDVYLGTVRTKNVPLILNGSEKLTAIKHANNKDIWVVSHPYGVNNIFYSYLVTGSGIQAPVVSSSGANLSIEIPGNYSAPIKISPDGKTLVCLDWASPVNSVQLYDFNNATGSITNARTIANEAYYYGAEFSHSGRYLYLSNIDAGYRVEQFDMKAGSLSDILNSRSVIYSGSTWNGAIERGPDGRIYIAQANQFLSVINFPDRPGSACGFSGSSVSLLPGRSMFGLPARNLSPFLYSRVGINYTCYRDSTRLVLTDTTGSVDSLVWYFGDTASAEKISRDLSPRHVYSQPGTYLGMVYIYRHVFPHIDSVNFEVIITKYGVSLGPDRTICKGASVSLKDTFWGNPAFIEWDHGLGTGKSKMVSPASTTTYTAIGDAGCMYKDTDRVTVYVRSPVKVGLYSDTLICPGSSVMLNAIASGGDSTYTFTWNNGLGTGSSKTVSPIAATTYRVIADDGCTQRKDTGYVTVNIRSPLKVSLRQDTTICPGHPIILTAVTEGGDSSYTFTWDNGLGMGNPKTVAPLLSTTYRVIADDGCITGKDTAYVRVSVLPAAGLVPGKDTAVCKGESVTLSAQVFNAVPGYTLSWDHGLGTGSPKIVNPFATTAYVVTLSDGCSPDVKDTLEVDVEIPPVIEFTCDTIVCEGEEVSFDNLTAGPAPSYQYNWLFGDGNSTSLAEPAHVYQEEGLYSVTLTAKSGLGCAASMTKGAYIRVHPKPLAFFATDPLSTDIEHPQVNMINLSSGAGSYHWNFGDNTTSSDISPQHIYTDAGQYPIVLIAGNNAGCYDTAMRSFPVKEVYHFYIPLSFSPNADGFNDEFRYSCTACSSVSMKVFNRWGEMVFASSKVDEFWNGGMNNVLPALPEGVYAYILDVRDSNKAMYHYKGMVTLIK